MMPGLRSDSGLGTIRDATLTSLKPTEDTNLRRAGSPLVAPEREIAKKTIHGTLDGILKEFWLDK